MEEINAGSTASVEISFTDENNNAIVPNNISYVIYDKNSGIIKSSGTIAPASTVDVPLTETDTQLINPYLMYEIIAIKVKCLFNDEVGINEFEIRLRNNTAI